MFGQHHLDDRSTHHLSGFYEARSGDGGSRVAPYLITAVSTAITAGMILLLIYSTTPELAPGQCSGIGWGCTLGPADAVGFALALGWPFALVPLAIVALIDLGGGSRSLQSWVGGCLPVLAGFALIMYAAAAHAA